MFDFYRDYHLLRYGFARFRFRCSKWFTNISDSESDFQAHIENHEVPLGCDPILFRGAIACAGYCPVHLGRVDLPIDERMQQYDDRSAWQRHILHYLPQYIEKCNSTHLPCPHPECSVVCDSKRNLWHHLGDIHRIPLPATDTERKANSAEDPGEVLERPPAKKQRIIINGRSGNG